jgi:hypothetical protein
MIIGCVLAISVFVNVANAGLIFRDGVDDSNGFTNGSWAFGTVFTVGDDDVNVTALGAFDYLGDGFLSNNIQVGIFDESTSTLLSSARVISSDALIGSFRYSYITSLLLNSGDTYRVVAVSGKDSYITNGILPIINTEFFNIESLGYCRSTTLKRCRRWDGDFGMASFQFTPVDARDVPEPSTLAIFALGMIGLASRRFKKQS